MKPQEIIRKKRDGAALARSEIAAFIKGVTDESWADYQTSALVMAMFLNGLNADEAAILTDEMLRSGEVLDFSDIEQPKADKHSTGGVGDKTSLIIAPLAAACGVAVPMISGRGLGHTGGTLDKLESIPGYQVNLSLPDFKRIIKTCGFAMSGQTAEIAPADRKLYALRDATATVESISLIVASIMSKKLAENLDALVLDVKTGGGAFMPEFADAQKLAEALCAVGNARGVKTQAVISDMNQPLGKYIGNALEVYECLEILRGDANSEMLPTRQLSLELTARMLVLTDVCKDLATARSVCEAKLQNGDAFDKFRQNVELQNGDPRVCDQPKLLCEKNLFEFKVKAVGSGFVCAIDAAKIGEILCAVGGGRIKVGDAIDFQIGFQCNAKIGDKVRAGETLGVLFCRAAAQAEQVRDRLQTIYQISDEKPAPLQLIKTIVS